ncbi:MAG: hypothetical protein GQ535_03020 [Rhodobacteraceae bacterium]|nr:hypothetical protein [Paracoccaceae bacterium]
MNKFLAVALISGMAVSAQAGSITYVAPENVLVEVEPNMGSGGSWVLPAVIASVLLVAILTQPQVTPQ